MLGSALIPFDLAARATVDERRPDASSGQQTALTDFFSFIGRDFSGGMAIERNAPTLAIYSKRASTSGPRMQSVCRRLRNVLSPSAAIPLLTWRAEHRGNHVGYRSWAAPGDWKLAVRIIEIGVLPAAAAFAEVT